MSTTVQFIGCGDAFGSGGRFNTCFYVHTDSSRFLIDCGASSLVALKRFGVDAAALDFVLVTHFHGDHFGGLPFLAVEERIVRRRAKPLVIAGPPGIGERVLHAAEALFPGSATQPGGLDLKFIEYDESQPAQICGATVRAFPVIHSQGSNPHAVRVECDGCVVAYSGDTEWTENLIPAADDADLFICEAYSYERKIAKHLDYRTLMEHRNQLRCKRLVLTHMHDDLLARLHEIREETAEDGKRIELC